jgi:hypothetical protein
MGGMIDKHVCAKCGRASYTGGGYVLGLGASTFSSYADENGAVVVVHGFAKDRKQTPIRAKESAKRLALNIKTMLAQKPPKMEYTWHCAEPNGEKIGSGAPPKSWKPFDGKTCPFCGGKKFGAAGHAFFD